MTPAVTDPAGSAIIGVCITNIENISNDNICFVYPNSSTNEFTIQNNSAQLFHFSLYNSLGEKLIDKTFANKTSTINISAFASDIYFYRVRNDEQVIKSGKIIKP